MTTLAYKIGEHPVFAADSLVPKCSGQLPRIAPGKSAGVG